jgi:hypothetical protein
MLVTSSKSQRILNYSKDYRKTDLNKLWSDRLIKILIAIQSKLHIRQEVLYGDIQRFYYDLGNMNRLTLKIKKILNFKDE